MQTLTIIISGKVQGVFYRQSTRDKARELHITGTVRNCADGTVEVIATGTKQQLDALTKWCRQGPEKAVVATVNARDEVLTKFDGFSILR